MYKTYFKTNRPTISDSSIKTYSTLINSLGKKLNIKIEKPIDIIENIDPILKFYENVPYNTRKTNLAAIISFIDDGSSESKEVLKILRKVLTNDVELYNKGLELQEKTENEIANWIEWGDVLDRYKAFEKEVAPLWRLKKEELTKDYINKLKTFVLLSCYVLIPPRRALDYTAFKIRNIDEIKDNYMKKRNFVFNNYKTAKTYGKGVVPIDFKLYSIIKKWIVINPSDWLIPASNNNRKPISVPQLTNLLNSFFDKKVSVNMLRHSFLTHIYKDMPDLKTMKDTAKGMGHSIEKALEYVKKEKS